MCTECTIIYVELLVICWHNTSIFYWNKYKQTGNNKEIVAVVSTVIGSYSCWYYLYPDNVPVMLLNWARLVLFSDRAEISFVSIEILFIQYFTVSSQLVSFFKHWKSFWDLKVQLKLLVLKLFFPLLFVQRYFTKPLRLWSIPLLKVV